MTSAELVDAMREALAHVVEVRREEAAVSEGRQGGQEVKRESIGKRLRRLRLEAGLSQRELSSPGVSYAYISRIEAGTRRPSVKALRKLAAKLGVTPEYLETGSMATTTDTYAPQLAEVSPGGFHVQLDDEGVVVTWVYDDESRKSIGSTLTDALLAALAWRAELERLRRERERLDVPVLQEAAP